MNEEIGTITTISPEDPATEAPAPRLYRDRVLTLRRLRGAMRKRRGTGIPSGLAEIVRWQIPEIFEPESGEIFEILEREIEEAERRLESAGIDPESIRIDGEEGSSQLTSRERRQLVDVAALLGWAAEAAASHALSMRQRGGDPTDVAARIQVLGDRSVAIARLAGDRRQLALSLVIRAGLNRVVRRSAEQTEEDYRESIDHLRHRYEQEPESIADLCWGYVRYAGYALGVGEAEVLEECIGQVEGLLEGADPVVSAPFDRIVHRTRAILAQRRMDQAIALREIRSSLRLSNPESDPVVHAQILHTLGSIYFDLEHFEEALQSYLESIEVLEEYGLAIDGQWVYYSACTTYVKLGEIEAGHDLLDRLADQVGCPSTIEETRNLDGPVSPLFINIWASRAEACLVDRDLDRAEEILDWVIPGLRAIDAPYNEAISCLHAASVRSKQGRPQEACRYLERAVAISGQNSPRSRLRFRLSLAEALVESGRLDEARVHIEQIAPMLEELGEQGSPRVRLLRTRSLLCERTGDPTAALRYERQASEAERELARIDRDRSVRFGRIVAETHLLEHSIEQERDQKHQLERALAGAVVELGAKKEIIEKVVAALQEEASRRREGSGREQSSPGRDPIASILVALRNDGGHPSPLAFLGPAADEFIDRLRLTHPELSVSQQRFCALLRFGLDTSEICSILDIGVDAVKGRRKRLRRVLGLRREESLEGVIAGM